MTNKVETAAWLVSKFLDIEERDEVGNVYDGSVCSPVSDVMSSIEWQYSITVGL